MLFQCLIYRLPSAEFPFPMYQLLLMTFYVSHVIKFNGFEFKVSVLINLIFSKFLNVIDKPAYCSCLKKKVCAK